MPKTFIAYTRVSTQKQGTQGVSLEEQQRAITDYAQHHSLTIGNWFTEHCSAAKNGRPVFQLVMKELMSGGDRLGLMMHKIDRGARNLKDWAMIGELIDQGVDVRFVHDNLDLSSRGGRLTADLQAVIAADYIRNLRDEVKKGIDGRVRQGLYPFKAPRGYLDRGRGRAKVPYPQAAPLVIAAFKLYAEATYSLHSLAAELHVRGLATWQEQPLSPNSLSRMLHNPFYVGQVVVKGRQTPGKHQPLVSPELFSQVQTVLAHRRPVRRHKHVFRYRGRLQCAGCQRCLIGEKQKQHIYYRCGRCKGICVREDRVWDVDRRFSILFMAAPGNKPLLEPYEKFDSAKGGRRFEVL